MGIEIDDVADDLDDYDFVKQNSSLLKSDNDDNGTANPDFFD